MTKKRPPQAPGSCHAHPPSLLCELPLGAEPAAIHAVNARLEAARQVYNACLGEALRQARLLRERRAYSDPAGSERGGHNAGFIL